MTLDKNKVLAEILQRFNEFAETLDPVQTTDLVHVGTYLIQNIVAAYLLADARRVGADLSRPLPEICSTLMNGLEPLTKTPDEAIRAPYLAVASASEILAAIGANKSGYPQADSMLIGFRLGQADVRLTQVISGLWGMMAEADATYQVAAGRAEAQRAGGAKRGEQIAQLAEAWKAEALQIALKLDERNPMFTRDKMATEVLERIVGEQVPGHKSIEVWLRQEAEHPNGPIRSRARKKPA